MSFLPLFRPAALLSFALFAAMLGRAQDAQPTPSFVLQTGTRLVVEDVLVTDAHGNAVAQLPASAFHVLDNGKPQRIRDFSAASSAALPPPKRLPRGVFSNATYLSRNDAVSQVLLIDADSMEPEVQLYALQEMAKAINTMPREEQAALFCVRSGRPIQLRDFTDDHDDLKRGLHECLPSLELSGEDKFASALSQLQVVAATLQPVPGRKEVLWFAGPFPLVPLAPDQTDSRALSSDVMTRIKRLHEIEESLAEARIAVFPIDPQGVRVTNSEESNRSDPTPGGQNLLATGVDNTVRYGYMHELAQATGGTDYHLNDLHEHLERVMQASEQAYTLSYAPQGYTDDQSWHKVEITVDGPYRVSYRRGYLATWTGGTPHGGQLLDASAATQVVTSSDTLTAVEDKPILFQVQPCETSAAPMAKGNSLAVSVSIPAPQLLFHSVEGTWSNKTIITTYAYDDFGRLKGGARQELTSALNEAQWKAEQDRHVETVQHLELPRSARYLLFVVEDLTGRRRGRLLLPARTLQYAAVTFAPATGIPSGAPAPTSPHSCSKTTAERLQP